MSAEILRRAAALMRERAESATGGPWTTHESHGRDYADEGWSYFSVNADKSAHVTVAELNSEEPFRDDPRPDLEHIASWHPDVALAAAHMVNLAAALLYPADRPGVQRVDACCRSDAEYPTEEWCAFHVDALTVARTYLGSDA